MVRGWLRQLAVAMCVRGCPARARASAAVTDTYIYQYEDACSSMRALAEQYEDTYVGGPARALASAAVTAQHAP